MVVALFAADAPGSREVRSAAVRAAAAGDTFMTPVFCLGEFWRVATEPRGYGASPETALAFLRDWNQRAPVVYPDRRFEAVFVRELARLKPQGAFVFDLAIGTLTRQRGADAIWTADAQFPQLEGLLVLNPTTPQP